MQAVAAEFPGCAENSTAFWREEFGTLCFDSFIFKNRPSTISFRSLAVHETGVRQDMVLGF
jgi:hypothetical protein